jgi:hypothetical protein
MIANMLFWHRRSRNLETTDQQEAREQAQRCAVDAAPFLHPRLSAVAASVEADRSITEILDGMTEQEAVAAWAESRTA